MFGLGKQLLSALNQNLIMKSYDVGKQYSLKNFLCEAVQSFKAAVDKGTIKTPIDLIK